MASGFSTVMGPDPASAHRSLLTPPKLSNETDKYQWRNDVKTWAQIVKRYAKGGDNRARGMMNALAFTLFYSLERDQRNIIDNAIRCRLLQLDLDDDETETQSLSTISATQFKLVNDIVQLIAKDSPTDGIRRLVKISQNIHQCTRTKSEKPNIFARKFQGMAKQYLNMCNPAQSIHESQNFAVLLLENAKLPSATFNNIVTQLVTKSASKSEDMSSAMINVPADTFTELMHKNALMTEASTNWQSTLGISANTFEVQELIKHINIVISTIDTVSEDARNSLAAQRNDDRATYSLTLDDAVEALCDIKADDDTRTSNLQTSEQRKPSDSDHSKQGTMMTKRREPDSTLHEPIRKKSYIFPGTGKKKDSVCLACKKKGHWKGDFECELHPMHQQWLERNTAKMDKRGEKQVTIDDTQTYFQ